MAREQEFAEFALARAPHLHRAAWLLCGDTHRAEDLVQETLTKVYTRWMRRIGKPIDNPAAYAQTVLVNTFISTRRRRSEHEQPLEVLPEPATTDSDTSTAELRVVLARALATLEPLDRAVLVLRYLDDVSVAETADRLGLSQGAVRNRSLRALTRLRESPGLSLPELFHS